MLQIIACLMNECNHNSPYTRIPAYIRNTDHRWASESPGAKKPVNSTNIQKYYRALSCLFGWLIREELLTVNSLAEIKMPRAEKKVIRALNTDELNELAKAFGDTFEGKRNKAMILVLVDCGLRLGEQLNLKLNDVDMNQQLMEVHDKTGERIVRFGTTTAIALSWYLKDRDRVNGNSPSKASATQPHIHRHDLTLNNDSRRLMGPSQHGGDST